MADTEMRLADWISTRAPIGWRDGDHDPNPTDAAIRMLQVGADAWTQLLLVKKALLDAGILTIGEVDGDLAERLPSRLAEAPPYVFDLLDAFLTGEPLNFGNHPVPVAVQRRLEDAASGDLKGVSVDTRTARLTDILLAEARDGETAAEVALRLIEGGR